MAAHRPSFEINHNPKGKKKMKRWKHRLVLLGVAMWQAVCVNAILRETAFAGEQKSPHPNERISTGKSRWNETPYLCTIASATPTPSGVRLVFGMNMSWHFNEPKGGIGIVRHGGVDVDGAAIPKNAVPEGGIIGSGQVIRFLTVPPHRTIVLPTEHHLDLEFGQVLSLSDHHAGCNVSVTSEQGRPIMRIKRSFCWIAMPCTNEEAMYELDHQTPARKM